MTSRRQSTDVPRVNFRQLAGVEERRVRGAGKAAAEEALALLLSGEAKSQAAAAAAVGISEGRLSSLKTLLRPAQFKFNKKPTELIELSNGVTFVKELSSGDETNMSVEEKRARTRRNFKNKMAALRQAAAAAAAAAVAAAVAAVQLGACTELESANLGAEQAAGQACAELRETEPSGAEAELDETSSELTDPDSELWREIEALNGPSRSAAACQAAATVALPGTLTRQIIGLDHGPAERRTRSHAPHEWAALTPGQRRLISQHRTACVCACCGDSRGFDVELGRAQSLQDGSCAMYGANDFNNHEVSVAVLMAEAYMVSVSARERRLSPVVAPACGQGSPWPSAARVGRSPCVSPCEVLAAVRGDRRPCAAACERRPRLHGAVLTKNRVSFLHERLVADVQRRAPRVSGGALWSLQMKGYADVWVWSMRAYAVRAETWPSWSRELQVSVH